MNTTKTLLLLPLLTIFGCFAEFQPSLAAEEAEEMETETDTDAEDPSETAQMPSTGAVETSETPDATKGEDSSESSSANEEESSSGSDSGEESDTDSEGPKQPGEHCHPYFERCEDGYYCENQGYDPVDEVHHWECVVSVGQGETGDDCFGQGDAACAQGFWCSNEGDGVAVCMPLCDPAAENPEGQCPEGYQCSELLSGDYPDYIEAYGPVGICNNL